MSDRARMALGSTTRGKRRMLKRERMGKVRSEVSLP
eukprot:CAMPEP_0202889542 /NCGR_PEP_ID=MMETSP1392-20130828/123_1 /ASSEMBLY_ACC=CAM_ASM_000868 /TAXON_ID=225041 /ORGANISM="Chlamydomonas chlamydogama, Strain SAG 11-48b" /LENGTH=35 /DNA_ID= /DNA_START= /DNA_END= /DNA_ORIENTATION=